MVYDRISTHCLLYSSLGH